MFFISAGTLCSLLRSWIQHKQGMGVCSFCLTACAGTLVSAFPWAMWGFICLVVWFFKTLNSDWSLQILDLNTWDLETVTRSWRATSLLPLYRQLVDSWPWDGASQSSQPQEAITSNLPPHISIYLMFRALFYWLFFFFKHWHTLWSPLLPSFPLWPPSKDYFSKYLVKRTHPFLWFLFSLRVCSEVWTPSVFSLDCLPKFQCLCPASRGCSATCPDPIFLHELDVIK